MKEQIYQNGFYLLIGLILGILVTLCYKPKPMPVTVEIKRDSVQVVDNKKPVAKAKLSDKTLYQEIKKQNLSHPHIVLAQAKLETGGYRSKVCKTHNNLFGLRKGNSYRKYNHWSESVTAYKKLIQSRYKGGDYFDFLADINYAEDPEYINKLKGLIQ